MTKSGLINHRRETKCGASKKTVSLASQRLSFTCHSPVKAATRLHACPDEKAWRHKFKARIARSLIIGSLRLIAVVNRLLICCGETYRFILHYPCTHGYAETRTTYNRQRTWWRLRLLSGAIIPTKGSRKFSDGCHAFLVARLIVLKDR